MKISTRDVSLPNRWGVVLASILCVAIYWLSHNWGDIASDDLIITAFMDSSFFDRYFYLTSSASIVLLLILIPVFSFVKFNSSIKLAIGIFIAFFAFALLLFLPFESGDASIFITAILLSLSEVIIVPVVQAIIAKFTNPKYYATVFGLSIAATAGVMWLAKDWYEPYLHKNTFAFSIKLVLGILFIIGAMQMIIGFVIPEPKPSLEETKPEPEERPNPDLLDQ